MILDRWAGEDLAYEDDKFDGDVAQEGTTAHNEALR